MTTTQRATPPPPQPAPPSPQQQALAHMEQQFTEQLQALVEVNKAGFLRLAQRNIRFEPFAIAMARVDSLIDSIAASLGPQGNVWALQARLQYEQRVAENIASAEQEGTTIQLAQGASYTPAMIAELARQTGVFGRHG